MLNYYTVQKNFYGNRSPKDLLKEFAVLYVYNDLFYKRLENGKSSTIQNLNHFSIKITLI